LLEFVDSHRKKTRSWKFTGINYLVRLAISGAQ
jgi:hypothetical protein